MSRKKLYLLSKKLGLTKKDLDDILSSELNNQNNFRCISPVEIYKGGNKYGTTSIKDLWCFFILKIVLNVAKQLIKVTFFNTIFKYSLLYTSM